MTDGLHPPSLDNMCNHVSVPDADPPDPWPPCTTISEWQRGWYAYLRHTGSYSHSPHAKARAHKHSRERHKHKGCEPGYEGANGMPGICNSISSIDNHANSAAVIACHYSGAQLPQQVAECIKEWKP